MRREFAVRKATILWIEASNILSVFSEMNIEIFRYKMKNNHGKMSQEFYEVMQKKCLFQECSI